MIDLDYSSLSQDTYEYNKITYIMLYVTLIAGCLMMVISIILIFIFCNKRNKNQSFSPDKFIEEDSKINNHNINNKNIFNMKNEKNNYYLEVQSTH